MARPKQFDEARSLEKAMHVFWQKGYVGTSMQDLVVAMGINAPSLYGTYGDKRRLFMLALKNYQQDQQRWIQSLIDTGQPAKDIIRHLLMTMVEQSLSDAERKGCFMVNTTTELANQDEEISCLVAANEHWMRTTLARLLEAGRQRGELLQTGQPTDVVAAYLFTVIQGIRVTMATNQNRELLTATVDLVIESI